MKKKKYISTLFIVLGISIVSISTVLVFQSGEFFKGLLVFQKIKPVTLVIKQDIFVSAEGMCNHAYNAGTIKCPFFRIIDAFDFINVNNINASTIKVAQGSYAENINFNGAGKEINLIGGYDLSFTSTSGASNFQGSIIYNNVFGKLSNFAFSNINVNNVIRVINTLNSNKTLEISFNSFNNNSWWEDNYADIAAVTINGSTVKLSKNFFDGFNSHGDIVRVLNYAIAEKNYFHNCLAENISGGIIYSENGLISNNLIIQSREGTNNIIYIKGNSKVVYNTLGNNYHNNAVIFYKGGISGDAKVINNLIMIENGNIIEKEETNIGNIEIKSNGYYWTTNYNINLNDDLECIAGITNELDNGADAYRLIPLNIHDDGFDIVTNYNNAGHNATTSCIDAGANITTSDLSPWNLDLINVDLFGNLRPQGSSNDIGFHEYRE